MRVGQHHFSRPMGLWARPRGPISDANMQSVHQWAASGGDRTETAGKVLRWSSVEGGAGADGVGGHAGEDKE